MKKDFYFPSADGMTQIHAIEWIPEGTPKAILQIAHGMVEHIERYDAFASYLSENGIYNTKTIKSTDSTYKEFIAGNISLGTYLQYAINQGAVDISSFNLMSLIGLFNALASAIVIP